MSDRCADTSAFEEAKAVVERIGTQASRQPGHQTFTLLRFSQAGRLAAGAEPDLLKEAVDTEFGARLHQTIQPLEPSHTAAGPIEALEAMGELMGESEGDHRIVYLISDFRARQWQEPADLRNHLARLSQADTKLHLIDCVDASRPNLAVAELSPGAGTRAAGVPLPMEVAVKNFGTVPVKDVPVMIEADGYPQPGLKIAQIPPGEVVKERFTVRFPVAGEHVITARVETDAVAVDNAHYRVVDFPEHVPVLLVDGDPEALDARFLSAAFAPGGPVQTGVSPQIETPRYLSRNPLEPFRAVYLLNVGRLDPSAIEALEEYVKAGGGVGVFLGERCRSQFINEELYRDGEGFFPLPVSGQAELLVDRLQNAPDLKVGRHPIFRIFAGERNSFLWMVSVGRYFAVPEDWEAAPDSATQVIARLRNGAPLAVEWNFGQGRVVAFLTTAAPVWNNWAQNNPSFVVAMLELQSYLSNRPAEDVSSFVGTPLELRLDPSEYDAQVRFATPEDAVPTAAVDAVPGPGGSLTASLPVTERSGVYQAVLKRKDGEEAVRRFALNVQAEEGDLKTVTGPELAVGLKGVQYEYAQAAMFQYAADERAGYNLAEPLLYLLILVLVGEQILAWSASYHPRSWRRPAEGGAR
jgi:hypothetical protein